MRHHRILAGLFLATVSVAAVNQAHAADDSVTLQEVRDLKAKLKLLEQRLDAQAKEQKKINAYQMAPAPVSRGGVPVAYEPPQPWDKKWHLNGITITPGGFFAAEGVWRSHDMGADIDTPFASIPFPNASTAHTNETRFTARQSRVSALVEGPVNASTLISGYGELDFLGAANTANSNQSNSYNPRIRNLYATVDWNDYGLHLLAGQSWSLATLQGKGISPRNEVIPATIDAQYVAGFVWARQPGVRLTYNYGPDFWAAVSAELPQNPACPAAVGAAIPAGAVPVAQAGTAGVTCNQAPVGGGLLDAATTYSLSHIPDIIGKVAYEPTLLDRKIHMEAFGIYTDLYDRVAYTPFAISNQDTTGWGFGGSVIVPLIPKWVDLQGSALFGRGVERYGTSQLQQSAFNANGALGAVPGVMYMAGATVHATPQLDLYAYGGQESISSKFFNTTPTTFVGVGVPNANNSGCYIEATTTIASGSATCAGATKSVFELTGGFWYKAYEGAFGSLRVGAQYEFIQRDLFPGFGATAPFPAFLGSAPKTTENIVMTSLRYYPFDAPPPAPPLVAKY